MTHPDGEEQIRHEDGQRVDAQAHERQHAEQPHHRQQRDQKGPPRQRPRAGVEPQQHRGERAGRGKEQQHAAGAFADVADHLGEADDVHVDLRVGVLGAQRFEPGGHLFVIELLRRAGDLVLQLELHQRALEVVADQVPDLARLLGVGAHRRQVFGRTAEARADHAAASEALLGDLDVAHARRPERGDRFALDAVDEEHVVRHGLEPVEKGAVEDVALLAHQSHDHGVGAAKSGLVMQEGLHESVVARNGLLEPRIGLQAGGRPAQRHGGQHEAQQDRQPPADQHIGEPGGEGIQPTRSRGGHSAAPTGMTQAARSSRRTPISPTASSAGAPPAGVQGSKAHHAP